VGLILAINTQNASEIGNLEPETGIRKMEATIMNKTILDPHNEVH
jgi:hypothetical protein